MTRVTAIIEDDMADVAEARVAITVMWVRILQLTRRPAITTADIDCLSDELRRIEAGLNTIDKWLTEKRSE